MNVPFEFIYHAEIMYETENCFNFCNANGNTIEELLKDIKARFYEFKDREPKLVEVLKNPNDNAVDITWKIRDLIDRSAA